MGVVVNRSIFGVRSLLAQNLADTLCLLIFRFCFFVSMLVDILVNARCGTVSEEWFVIEGVVFIMAKARLKTSCLVEETLVEHGFTRSWLCLAESNFLRDVSILIALGLRLFETCSFHSVFSDNFSASLGSDLISLTFRFFLLPL